MTGRWVAFFCAIFWALGVLLGISLAVIWGLDGS